jgi:hypothetical protein
MDIADLMQDILQQREKVRSDRAPPRLHEISWDSLRSYVTAMKSAPQTPIFQLAAPEDRLIATHLNAAGLEPRRHPVSGTLDIRLPKRENLEELRFPFEKVLSFADALDERAMFSLRQELTETVRAEVDTLIDGLPVIGPGGRLTFYEGLNHIQVDIVLRKRTRPIPTAWRSPDDIAQEVRVKAQQQAAFDEGSKIAGMLGYFELSKYEFQTWLRPAYLFYIPRSTVIEAAALPRSPVDAPRHISLRRISIVVVPATSSAEVEMGAGLGSWS